MGPTTSPPATWSTTPLSSSESPSCTGRSSASRDRPRCSSPMSGRATAASSPSHLPPSSHRLARRPASSASCPGSSDRSRPLRRSRCCSSWAILSSVAYWPTTPSSSRSAPSTSVATRPARPVGPTRARSSSPSTTTCACRTRTESDSVSGPKRIKVNGVELYWGQWGDARGPPLGLCHGFTGSSHDFALQVQPLSESRRVIAVDQRGHGLSSKTHDIAGYSIDQLTADLIGFIEQVSEGPVDLLGHSMGGRVSLGVVLARPDLVRSLVLMDTSAWSFLPDDEKVRTMIADYMDAFDPARGMPSSFGISGPEDALIEAATTAEWWQRKEELFSGVDAYAVKAFGTELFSGIDSLRPQLPTIGQPTAVIAGSHDHPLVDQAPDLAAEVAHGQLCVIEGAYHSPQLTHPQQWREAVEHHLAPLDS